MACGSVDFFWFYMIDCLLQVLFLLALFVVGLSYRYISNSVALDIYWYFLPWCSANRFRFFNVGFSSSPGFYLPVSVAACARCVFLFHRFSDFLVTLASFNFILWFATNVHHSVPQYFFSWLEFYFNFFALS